MRYGNLSSPVYIAKHKRASTRWTKLAKVRIERPDCMQKQDQEKSSLREARCNLTHRASSFVGNFRQSITKRFGQALRERRKALGLTQTDLATTTGLSRSYISEVECGRETISLERAEKLAQAVNVPLSDLLRDS